MNSPCIICLQTATRRTYDYICVNTCHAYTVSSHSCSRRVKRHSYIKYLRIWPTVCGKAYLLEWTALTIISHTLSLCSCECLLSGLWHHCRHRFGSPCRRHPHPILHHRLLLLLLCLVSAEGHFQEEEGWCQIHFKRPVPWWSCSDVAEWLDESICYILY